MVQEAFVRAEELLVPPPPRPPPPMKVWGLPEVGICCLTEKEIHKNLLGRSSVERGIAHRTSLPDPGTMRCLKKLVPEQKEQLKTLAAQDASAKLESQMRNRWD